MKSSTSSPAEEAPRGSMSPEPKQRRRIRPSIAFFLGTITLLLIMFIGLIARNVVRIQQDGTQSVSTPTATASSVVGPQLVNDLLDISGTATPVIPQIAANQYLIYEQQKSVFMVPAAGGQPKLLTTPGYIYNAAVPATLLPGSKLLYEGTDGLWLTDIIHGGARQVAAVPHGQDVTSLVVNTDGTLMAWSTAPAHGKGKITIYAGALEYTVPIYEQTTEQCPCMRVFSLYTNGGKTTVLLTDDRGDHQLVSYGLWTLPLDSAGAARPQAVLDEQPSQGPMLFSSINNLLLYTSYKGFVPAPEDASIPDEQAALTYANNLLLTSLSSSGTTLAAHEAQVVLPEQRTTSGSTARWVTTPAFSPDGRTLMYVVFSTDTTSPFHRHNALYQTSVNANVAQVHTTTPELFATTAVNHLEMGLWINNHLLSFYADGGLYVLDIQNGGVSSVTHTGSYAHIVAVAEMGVA